MPGPRNQTHGLGRGTLTDQINAASGDEGCRDIKATRAVKQFPEYCIGR